MLTEWITIAEAAAQSGYHPERVRELIREGKLQATKKGTMWWIDRKTLLVFMKSVRNMADGRYGPKTTSRRAH